LTGGVVAARVPVWIIEMVALLPAAPWPATVTWTLAPGVLPLLAALIVCVPGAVPDGIVHVGLETALGGDHAGSD